MQSIFVRGNLDQLLNSTLELRKESRIAFLSFILSLSWKYNLPILTLFFIMNIFVAKLNFDTTSEDLQSAFENFGEVSSAKVIMDRETGRSKGFGFVEMPNDDEGNSAIENLNETELDGRTIVVKVARPKEDNRGGGGGYNRGGGGGGYNRGGGGGGYNSRY